MRRRRQGRRRDPAGGPRYQQPHRAVLLPSPPARTVAPVRARAKPGAVARSSSSKCPGGTLVLPTPNHAEEPIGCFSKIRQCGGAGNQFRGAAGRSEPELLEPEVVADLTEDGQQFVLRAGGRKRATCLPLPSGRLHVGRKARTAKRARTGWSCGCWRRSGWSATRTPANPPALGDLLRPPEDCRVPVHDAPSNIGIVEFTDYSRLDRL